MELTQQEVCILIGEQQLQLMLQRKHIATLEAKIKELSASKISQLKEISGTS